MTKAIIKKPLTEKETKLFDLLNSLKKEVDLKIEQNTQMLDNENYVNQMVTRLIIEEFNKKNNISVTADIAKNINTLLVKEYIKEDALRELLESDRIKNDILNYELDLWNN